jgi:putative tryptophan/tyrosine transport system substrate-binding protein
MPCINVVEGQNVSIEYRWITDRYGPLPAMATDLVQRRVAIIGAFGPPAVLAAKAATTTIPIVFVTGADPLKFGFVASFNHPGGNVTGIWMVSTVLAQKRLQLVRELLPKAELITLLVNPTSPVAEPQIQDAQVAARALGLKLIVLGATTRSATATGAFLARAWVVFGPRGLRTHDVSGHMVTAAAPKQCWCQNACLC